MYSPTYALLATSPTFLFISLITPLLASLSPWLPPPCLPTTKQLPVETFTILTLLFSATDCLYDKISALSCPNLATFVYNSSLLSTVDTLAPLTTHRIRPRPLQPWQTDNTRCLKKCICALELLWRKTKTQQEFDQYNST
ncbi:unnamed protein product, partial [Staurois parvus]